MYNKLKMLLNSMEIVYTEAINSGVEFKDKDEYAIAKELVDVLEKSKTKKANLRVIKNAE